MPARSRGRYCTGRAALPDDRDFSLVDQDQSDNVVTHYLATRTADRPDERRLDGRAAEHTDLANGSDNLLLTKFVDPASAAPRSPGPTSPATGRPPRPSRSMSCRPQPTRRPPDRHRAAHRPDGPEQRQRGPEQANAYRSRSTARDGRRGALTQAAERPTAPTCSATRPASPGCSRTVAMFQNAPSVDAGDGHEPVHHFWRCAPPSAPT